MKYAPAELSNSANGCHPSIAPPVSGGSARSTIASAMMMMATLASSTSSKKNPSTTENQLGQSLCRRTVCQKPSHHRLTCR